MEAEVTGSGGGSRSQGIRPCTKVSIKAERNLWISIVDQEFVKSGTILGNLRI
jgi:hypothetical protein